MTIAVDWGVKQKTNKQTTIDPYTAMDPFISPDPFIAMVPYIPMHSCGMLPAPAFCGIQCPSINVGVFSFATDHKTHKI